MRIILTLILVSALISCSDTKEQSESVTVNAGNETIAQQLIEKLANNSVWFESVDKRHLKVKYKDSDKVILELNKLLQSHLPKGRSASFTKTVYAELLNKLNKSNIEYEVVDFDNSKWVVWQEKDADVVEKLIDEATSIEAASEVKEKDFQN